MLLCTSISYNVVFNQLEQIIKISVTSLFMFYTSCIQYVFVFIIYNHFVYRHKTVCQSLNLTGRKSRNAVFNEAA